MIGSSILDRAGRRREALALLRLGRAQDSREILRHELRDGDGVRWLSDLIVAEMRSTDLRLAGELAMVLADLHRPSGEVFLTMPKLRHDLQQLQYLRERGTSVDEDLMEGYRQTISTHRGCGDNVKIPFAPADRQRIGAAYDRIVHMGDGPRLDTALSPLWDRETAQRKYQQRPGVVVIDDFLAPETLASLQRFCLESTVWSGNRYGDGRLGAFFFTGFNCPLLLQLAEEIRDGLPRIIGTRHPLRQLWGFKNTSPLPPGSTIHADFAAVNVNFWIVPTDANLDPSSGGMVIYDADAPPSWDFETYNERIDLIREYLSARSPGVIRIPYRQNRAVIFNSDLFHATEAVRFRPDFCSHRVNITMLYGERAEDAHHPSLPDDLSGPWPSGATAAWRSASFARARG